MTDEDLLEVARARMRECRDAEDPHIERAVEDLRFLSGQDQWVESDRETREAEGKPTLTFNALPQYVRKVCGTLRQLNPAIKVSAADGSATPEIAEIYEGLIREAEYRCDAASVYEGAAESAAQCGIGHFRIRTDYCDHHSFDQHIVIERIWNPFAVYYDPQAKEPTRSDAQFAFIAEEMTEEAFKEAFPDAKREDFQDIDPPIWRRDWRSKETVTVAEYFWYEYDEYDIGVTPMGVVIKGPFPEGIQIARKRKVRKPRVMWAKLSGDEVLEGPTRIAGEHIPVIAVVGEELHIGEEVYRSGTIRHAKDAQVTYNVMMTTNVETTLLQPRAPYLVTVDQVAGLEEIWNQANTSNRPYLPYAPDDKAGAPTRVPPPLPSQALIGAAQVAAEDMKRTIGIYDASLGARSNETSGVAIQSRQREAEISNSIYSDNMVKAVAHAGRVIVGMIPEIYDAPRVVRVLGEEAQEKIIRINQAMVTPDGIQRQNDMTAGKYSVRVSVGPAFSTKKAEASVGMMDFMAKIPNAAPLVADLVAGAQDWPGADRIAERLRKTIPPNVLEEDEKDQQQDPQAMQAQMQQAMQQQQAAQHAMQAELKKKVAEAVEAEADARKALAEAQEAEIKVRAMAAGLMNAGPVAPMPGQPA